jgi:predicted DNA-binding transcriptional regulator YafY
MLLLQTNGSMTARELSERLEVSERTIYRDLDALSGAGIPVYAERGPGGGLALSEDYRTSLTGLNESEVRSLFMSGVPGPLADLGLGKPMEDALLKLLASLPSTQRQDATRARQRIYLDAAGWNRPDEEVPHLKTMQEAIWQERRLCLIYRRGDKSEASERIVDPYGLVAKATVWYLVGAVEGQVRVFRVSRVNDAHLLDEHFQYPADFDLATYWTGWLVQFRTSLPRYPVTVRVSPQAIPILPMIFGEGIHTTIEKSGPPDAEGWRTLPLVFDSAEVARGRLLSFGAQLEVLEPPELRESIVKLAAELLDFYSA